MILYEGWNVKIWSSVCTGVDRQKIAVEYSSLTIWMESSQFWDLAFPPFIDAVNEMLLWMEGVASFTRAPRRPQFSDKTLLKLERVSYTTYEL